MRVSGILLTARPNLAMNCRTAYGRSWFSQTSAALIWKRSLSKTLVSSSNMYRASWPHDMRVGGDEIGLLSVRFRHRANVIREHFPVIQWRHSRTPWLPTYDQH